MMFCVCLSDLLHCITVSRSIKWPNFVPFYDWIIFHIVCVCVGASRLVLVVKNPPANAGKLEDPGSLPGSGRSPWGGHGNPLQYSCLENPMEGGAWKAIVHRVAKSRTWQHTHTHTHTHTHMFHRFTKDGR